jgi:hypothetical protein
MDIYVDNISICQIPKIFKNGFLQLDNGHDNELCINFYIDIYHIEWNKWKKPIWDNISYDNIYIHLKPAWFLFEKILYKHIFKLFYGSWKNTFGLI